MVLADSGEYLPSSEWTPGARPEPARLNTGPAGSDHETASTRREWRLPTFPANTAHAAPTSMRGARPSSPFAEGVCLLCALAVVLGLFDVVIAAIAEAVR